VLAQLKEQYPDDLRIEFRHFPLNSIHDKAALAAQASEAAGLQDRFWEMHDLLFSKQADWAGLTVDQFQTWLIEQAGELGLDTDQFTQDLTSDAIAAIAEQAWQQGQAAGLSGTPFMIFNGHPYQGATDLVSLSGVVDSLLLAERQFTECPPMTIDPNKKYTATLKTERGDIVMELFADKAPLAVNSFAFLAEQGWFDGISFHRVIPEFVAQSGDPSGSGFGGPGYVFDNEISADLKFDQAGRVGMANAGAGTNGSQFFITYVPLPQLDGGYTVFGQVISGMDVAESLTARDPSAGGDLPPGDKILSVVIEEK
jgi:cyclophilin family peptidyl-prolyl cis-trans isomerase